MLFDQPRIFFLDGVRPRQNAEWVRGARAEKLFQQWMDGETGIPLVDANMKELAATVTHTHTHTHTLTHSLTHSLTH